SIDKVGTGYTLTASDGTLGGATSTSFNITQGAANHLAFGVQPTNTTAGAAISPAVTVRVLDASNNLVISDNTDQVTLSVAVGPPNFTGSSTLPVTVSGGIAPFNNLVLNTAGNYTLAESGTGGLLGATSAAFTVNAATATHFDLTVPPTATAGTAFNITVVA